MSEGTLWRRAVKRVDRRAAASRLDSNPRTEALLREAVSLANRLFWTTGIRRPYQR